jgi:hypothetical protein
MLETPYTFPVWSPVIGCSHTPQQLIHVCVLHMYMQQLGHFHPTLVYFYAGVIFLVPYDMVESTFCPQSTSESKRSPVYISNT